MSQHSNQRFSKRIKTMTGSSKVSDYGVNVVKGVEEDQDEFLPEPVILHNPNRE